MDRLLRSPIVLLASVTCCAITPDRLIAAAKEQIGITLTYDDSYRSIGYPNGDFPQDSGCCTDVLIRAYRKSGIDLQALVHQDIMRNRAAYSRVLTGGRADTNIDHRRVATLAVFLGRNAGRLEAGTDPRLYGAGDIVIWRLPNGRLHIGLVSDARSGDRPLIIHNIGYGVRQEDALFEWKLIGHFRFLLSGA